MKGLYRSNSRSEVQLNRKRANALAELPGVLWILLLVFTFPMLDLATITMRYGILVTASHDAVIQGARSKTFSQNPSSSELSAVNAADQNVRNFLRNFNGITIQQISTNILITNLTTNQISRQSTVLRSPADTSSNLYQIETTVTSDVYPILTLSNPTLRIPGLTAPMRLVTSSRTYCENPQGLTL